MNFNLSGAAQSIPNQAICSPRWLVLHHFLPSTREAFNDTWIKLLHQQNLALFVRGVWKTQAVFWGGPTRSNVIEIKTLRSEWWADLTVRSELCMKLRKLRDDPFFKGRERWTILIWLMVEPTPERKIFVKIGSSSPTVGVENKTYLSCHHLRLNLQRCRHLQGPGMFWQTTLGIETYQQLLVANFTLVFWDSNLLKRNKASSISQDLDVIHSHPKFEHNTHVAPAMMSIPNAGFSWFTCCRSHFPYY